MYLDSPACWKQVGRRIGWTVVERSVADSEIKNICRVDVISLTSLKFAHHLTRLRTIWFACRWTADSFIDQCCLKTFTATNPLRRLAVFVGDAGDFLLVCHPLFHRHLLLVDYALGQSPIFDWDSCLRLSSVFVGHTWVICFRQLTVSVSRRLPRQSLLKQRRLKDTEADSVNIWLIHENYVHSSLNQFICVGT